jgi:hypothetical protein
MWFLQVLTPSGYQKLKPSVRQKIRDFDVVCPSFLRNGAVLPGALVAKALDKSRKDILKELQTEAVRFLVQEADVEKQYRKRAQKK